MHDASRYGTTQTIAFTASSVAIADPFATQTYQIRVAANAACHIRIGDGAQTATVADPLLPAGIPEYITVSPGQRIAAIRAATDGLVTATSGTLWVTELT